MRRLAAIGRISYDDVVTETMVQGKSAVEYSDSQVAQEIGRIWARLSEVLEVSR